MKRRRRRSTSSSTLSLGVPAIWLRKPSSLYCGTASMPDLPCFSDCVTSAALLPIEETIPKPVTTTRFMSAGRRGSRRRILEEPDFEAAHFVDLLAVGMDEAVGDAQHQLAQDHPLQMHMIGELLDGRHDHARELDLADAQRTAAARRLHPAEEEAQHLPQRVQRQAARHYRVALEVAEEEPEVRLDVEFGHDFALAEIAAGIVDLHDTVQHQHRRQRKLRVARTEQVAFGALDQVLESITVLFVAHLHPSWRPLIAGRRQDRKSTRLNSSHTVI